MEDPLGHDRLRRRWSVLFALSLTMAILTTTTRGARGADLPSGWTSDAAYAASVEAEAARKEGLHARCMERDAASIALEDRAASRAHRAGCAERAGKILEALGELRVVLDRALAARQADVAELAKRRVERLLRRVGRIEVTSSLAVEELRLRIDGVGVRSTLAAVAGSDDTLRLVVPVDPGEHEVVAEGVVVGVDARFERSVTVGEGALVTVALALRPRVDESRWLTAGQLACLRIARNQEEVARCLPAKTKSLVVRAGMELSGYGDTFAVRVLNPAVRAHVSSPTRGWSVGATYLVDVISAASPDFVSTASPHGRDLRHAATVSGGYKPGRVGADVSARFSTEADYDSRSGSIALSSDFADKRVTPRVGWSVTSDTIGRGGTPFRVFHNELVAHEAIAGATFVLSGSTVLVAAATAAFERGDPSKPYRLIPMFAPGTTMAAGVSADTVNARRLPVRPYEQLPLARDRYALSARLAWRFAPATLRVEERLYQDSWGIRATSTDARLLVDLGSRLTLGPHGRFHAQSGATFHQRVYEASTAPRVIVPALRTTDRELAPLWSMTGGLVAWWKLRSEDTGLGLGLYVSGDVQYSKYLDSLYVRERVATYGTVGLEAVFE